jgi:DNA-binding transcriptional LysR family regulator
MLSEIGSFSAVAEQLGITQPALSKQIMLLEKEIGIKLFNRKASPISLTAAGEHFISEAKELLYKEDQLIKSLEEYKSGEKGTLTIGITPFRSSYLMADIVSRVRSVYPKVKIKIFEESSDILRKGAAEGKYDFAIFNLPVDDTLLDAIPMKEDGLALILSDNLVEEYPSFLGKHEIEFKECKDLPFAVVSPSQEMRVLFDRLCALNGFLPNIAAEATELTTVFSLAKKGGLAALLPMQFVDGIKGDGGVSVIKLKDISYKRQPAVVTKKGQFLSEYARFAIEFLTK